MTFDIESDIAALSSASGRAGRTILRISGPNSMSVAANIFRPDNGTELMQSKGFTRINGLAVCDGVSLPACAYIFRKPRSYTRQDVIELHLPCPAAGADLYLSAALAAGARAAGPGEFTMRAMLSGRLDLARAEAVADIIAAENESQLRSAQANADGRLSRLCAGWSASLTELLAETEAAIDIAEEGLETLTPAATLKIMTELAAEMTEALAMSGRPTGSGNLPRVILIGSPNAGKSSLANALLGQERSIVSPVAGATRDTPSARWQLPGGAQAMLVDSAGLNTRNTRPTRDNTRPTTRDTTRPTRDSHAQHRQQFTDAATADQAAAQRTLAMLASAAIVVIVADLASDTRQCVSDIEKYLHLADMDEHSRRFVLIALTKSDLNTDARNSAAIEAISSQTRSAHENTIKNVPILHCSSLTGSGLTQLAGQIEQLLHESLESPSGAITLHSRQASEIRAALEIAANWQRQLPNLTAISDAAEFLSCDLREMLLHVGMIDGHAVGEEVLSIIFSRFCVGK